MHAFEKRYLVCQLEVIDGLPETMLASMKAIFEAARDGKPDFYVFPMDSFGVLPESGTPEHGDYLTLLLSYNARVAALCPRDAYAIWGNCGRWFFAANGITHEVSAGVQLFRMADSQILIAFDDPCDGCDLVIACERDPWYVGKKACGPFDGIPSLWVNAVAMHNRGSAVCVYDGGSAAFDSDGVTVGRMNDEFKQECMVVGEGDCPIHEPVPVTEKLLTSLTYAISSFDKHILGNVENSTSKWVIGLSGGLDSAVTAALLARALGPLRIKAYNLATAYNSQTTRMNAMKISNALGIQLRSGHIGGILDATQDVLTAFDYRAPMKGLVFENVQARQRGQLLATFAALENGVVANNGNLLECALGYATLYGDAIGALAPLASLTKVQIINLALTINELSEKEVIPRNLIPTITPEGVEWQTKPSAELSENQQDPMKWFYHDWLLMQLSDGTGEGLLRVMRAYARDKLGSTPVFRWIPYYGLDNPETFISDLEWFMKSIRRSTFKRLQSPPAVIVGYNPRQLFFSEMQGNFPHSAEYNDLKQEILGATHKARSFAQSIGNADAKPFSRPATRTIRKAGTYEN